MCDVGQVHYFVYVIVSAPLFEKPDFPPLNIFIPLSKISWIYLCGAVFGFSISFFIEGRYMVLYFIFCFPMFIKRDSIDVCELMLNHTTMLDTACSSNKFRQISWGFVHTLSRYLTQAHVHISLSFIYVPSSSRLIVLTRPSSTKLNSNGGCIHLCLYH